MAKVQSAVKVIETELKEARRAVEFYEKRVAALEDVLSTVTNIESTVASGGAAKRAVAKKGPAPKVKKPAGKTARSSKLPSTGKDFWPSLLTETPQSSVQIFKAATAALRIRPSAEDRKKLSQRMSNALSVLAKNGEINAEGGPRTRLYSRKVTAAGG